MCYAIVEVKYIAAGEQDQLVRCADAEALNKKVNELKALGTVASIQTFAPLVKLKRTVVWEEIADPYKPPFADVDTHNETTI